MEQGFQAAGTRLVRCLQPQEGHVSSVHRIGDGEVVGEDAQIDPFGVDLGGRVERQERTIGWPGSVGEQDNGVTLGLQPGGDEVGVPDDVSGLITINQRLVIEAERQLLDQEFAHRTIQPSLADLTPLNEVDDQLRVVLATELVHAGVDQLRRTSVHVEMLQTPGAGRHGLPEDHRFGDQPPVGADDAGETELIMEQIADDFLAEGESDLFVAGPDRHPVVGHHLSRACFDSGDEGLQVEVELAAGIYLLPPVGEVRVFAVELGAAAGEVLRHRGNGMKAKCRALEAPYVGPDQLSRQLSRLAEGGAHPGPTGFGGEIDLRVQCGADATGHVLPPCDVGELEHALRVPQGGQPKSLRPLGEDPGGRCGADVLSEGVAGIGGHGERSAGTGFHRQLLGRVAPGRQVSYRSHQARQVDMADVSADYQLTQARQIQTCHGLRQSATRTHHGHRMKHHPSLLGQAELGQQLVGSRCDLGGYWVG